MSEQYLSEIRLISFNFAPHGWALCNGQLLPINQNQALFALLGTTYGGNGQTTFALPNLQGRIPIHTGNGFVLGQSGGETAHTLTLAELPQHIHTAQGASANATQPSPSGNVWAAHSFTAYAHTANGSMAAGALSTVGGSQPHNNMPPYLVLNFIIALTGIFPSQN